MKNFFLLVLLPLSLFSCNSANTEKPSAQYEKKKESLADMERDNPLKFLKVNGDSHTNLINKEVVEGTIHNSATLAAYKDIEVRITFSDKSGSVIEKDTKIINEVIRPNTANDFKVKIKKPKGAMSVALDITGAVAEK